MTRPRGGPGGTEQLRATIAGHLVQIEEFADFGEREFQPPATRTLRAGTRIN